MTLTPGARLGDYEIVAKVGAGGMGEVFRARDTKLNREVAIKALPAAFAGDSERVARFTREARTLASLNHPNIAAIYGTEEVTATGGSGPGSQALVMELVEGEDLSAHIARGPIPVSEALAIARQIAEALEAAHEQGIVHRDLKPANIKVRTDGTVKVLDFGLAKAMDSTGAASSSANVSDSPTLTHHATSAGMIVGTAAYMSPEQARGKPVDRRTDIWAFGVVFHEMLTGKRLFAAENVGDALAAVLRADIDFKALPASTPRSARRLVARCLDRDPKTRLQHIGEARIILSLNNPGDDATEPESRPTPSSRRAARLATGLAATALTMTVVAGYLALRPAPTPLPARLVLNEPIGQSMGDDAVVSPDGRTIAFGRKGMIWLRSLSVATAYSLSGTEGGRRPFWSPGSDAIGFFGAPNPEGTEVRRIPVGGGQAQTLSAVPFAAHATWGRGDVILVSQRGGVGGGRSLYRFPATGGTAAKVEGVEKALTNETSARWPSFLPDGRRFLFNLASQDPSVAGILVGSLDSEELTRLNAVNSGAQYAAGTLFYQREGDVVAQPFDLGSLRLMGEASPVFENVVVRFGLGVFSVSDATIVAQARRARPMRRLTWMDRSGAVVSTLGDPGEVRSLDISPDGKQVAVVQSSGDSRPELWGWDLERGVLSLWRKDVSSARFSRDGARVATLSSDGVRSIAAGGGDERLLLPGNARAPGVGVIAQIDDWSPDDRYLGVSNGMTQVELLGTGGQAERRPSGEGQGLAFSPQGGWFARGDSLHMGRENVFLEPLAGTPVTGPGRIQVSSGGGHSPRWRADGRELFYLSTDGQLMTTSVTLGPRPILGTPKPLFKLPSGAHYDVAADGQRFLVAVPEGEAIQPPLSVILNWRSPARQ